MTDDRPSSKPENPPSELGAAEAMGEVRSEPGPKAQEAGSGSRGDGSVQCPNCGRVVEPGFRFCDGCGTRLSEPSLTDTSELPEAKPVRLTEATPEELPDAKPVELSSEPTSVSATDVTAAEKPKEPLLARLRGRMRERSQLGQAEKSLEDSPQLLDAVSEVIEAPVAPKRPMTAEELRGARPAIGGRLRWLGDEKTETTGTLPPPPVTEIEDASPRWRPLPLPTTEEPERSGVAEGIRFGIHFGIAFLSGAISLLLLTGLSSVVSDGSVAILEMRGLPIFIGGATSIVVFALLRTNARNRPTDQTRQAALKSIIGGLLALVALAALLYQPAVASRIQPRIERALQLYGGQDADAVDGVKQSVVEWNRQAGEYHEFLKNALESGSSPDSFRARAAQAEADLSGITDEMGSNARRAQHPELRDALSDLASIFGDQLAGLRLVDRGLLVNNIQLVGTGDDRFKDAHNRAVALFQSRLSSLLSRGGLDAQSFGRALGG